MGTVLAATHAACAPLHRKFCPARSADRAPDPLADDLVTALLFAPPPVVHRQKTLCACALEQYPLQRSKPASGTFAEKNSIPRFVCGQESWSGRSLSIRDRAGLLVDRHYPSALRTSKLGIPSSHVMTARTLGMRCFRRCTTIQKSRVGIGPRSWPPTCWATLRAGRAAAPQHCATESQAPDLGPPTARAFRCLRRAGAPSGLVNVRSAKRCSGMLASDPVSPSHGTSLCRFTLDAA